MPGIEGLPLGNQIWADTDLKTSYDVLGKTGQKRKDGYDKVSGRAIYTRDYIVPGMLYGIYMTSPYPNCEILEMDTSAAEKAPGVRYVLRYDDPLVKDRTYTAGARPIYWLGKYAYQHGETCGAVVVADSEQEAHDALRMIKVTWKENPFVIEPSDAIKEGAPKVNPLYTASDTNFTPSTFKMGDYAAGVAAADGTVEWTARKSNISGAGAEPISLVATWDGKSKLELVHHTQTMGSKRTLVSAYLGVQRKDVLYSNVYHGHMGGHFQWVATVQSLMMILGALLSRKLGRPVKMLYDRKDDWIANAIEWCHYNLKASYKKDGTITAVYGNNYAVYSMMQTYEHLEENTSIPNLLFDLKTVRTNTALVGAMRCEQVNNFYALNQVTEHVARALNMDPTIVAMKNDGFEGHGKEHMSEYKKAHGFPDVDSLAVGLAKAKEAFGWDAKWHPAGTKKLPNGRMHGVGFTWCHQWQDASGDASMAVAFNPDGSVQIMCQQADIGVNQRTSLCAVVAEELGVPLTSVDFHDRGFSSQTFELEPPAGSSAFTANSWAAKYAARKARASLLEFATHDYHYASGFGGNPAITHAKAAFPGKTAAELDIKDGVVFEKAKPDNKLIVAQVVARAGFGGQGAGAGGQAPGIFAWQMISQPAKADGDSNCRHRWLGRAAYFAEVEVDTETGEIFVTNYTNLHDAGFMATPESFLGQMYGGNAMAWGRAALEEPTYDTATGVLLNNNLIDYKVATIKDILPGTSNNVVVETGVGWGAYGSIGCGELVATCAFVPVGFAVYNAIGKSIEDFPLTPAKVLKALGKA